MIKSKKVRNKKWQKVRNKKELIVDEGWEKIRDFLDTPYVIASWPQPRFPHWAALAVSFASSSFRAAVGETIYRVNREKEVSELPLERIISL